jgi:hypothetical protein
MDINIDQSKELILTAAKASCHSCLSCHTSTEKSPVSKKNGKNTCEHFL